jgi:S-adenosylmethionine decarboxylase proenzyme
MLKIKQLLIDLYDCKVNLNDPESLLSILETAAAKVRSHVVRRITQTFDPAGITAILILAETHLSIHTWPEHGYAAVDIFICGSDKDPYQAWEEIKIGLKPKSYDIKENIRTIGDTR